MIDVAELEGIIDRLLCSTVVIGSQPISAMLIAPSDAGKSKLVIGSKHSGDGRYVKVLADGTGEALIQYISLNKPRYLIFPDFNMVLSHRPTVAQYTIAVLLALLGEGAREIPNLEGKDKLHLEEAMRRVGGLRTGILMCMTPDMFFSHRGHWRKLGLLRRLIPISYRYHTTTVLHIIDGIVERAVNPVYGLGKVKLPTDKNVSVSPEYRRKIATMATAMQDRLQWVEVRRIGTVITKSTEYPFSMIDALIRYSMAAAAHNGNSEVGEQEYKDIEILCKYISVTEGTQI